MQNSQKLHIRLLVETNQSIRLVDKLWLPKSIILSLVTLPEYTDACSTN